MFFYICKLLHFAEPRARVFHRQVVQQLMIHVVLVLLSSGVQVDNWKCGTSSFCSSHIHDKVVAISL